MPLSGDRSDTGVLHESQHRQAACPFKGDRSDTFVEMQSNAVSGIPLSGDRSAMAVSVQ